MKHLLRVLFVLALFFGFASNARAVGIDFHVQVLDPNGCDPSSVCTVVDPGVPFPVTFLAAACTPFGLPNPPIPPPFGCLELVNDSLTTTITSLELTFTVPGSVNALCSTDGVNFANASCSALGGVETFLFTGGPGLAPLHTLVILESGVSPDGLVGTAVANPVPEPDSLLLFSTGAMLMTAGLYMKKQRRFAFGKR
jgi:hypothetical protein